MSNPVRRYLGIVLLILPLFFLFRALGEVSIKPFPEVLVSAASLVIIPGYAALRSLRIDPLRTASGYGWPLVVPLGLAVDVLLGLVLISTPIGLSAVTLWSGLSIISLASLGLTWES
jgi:hypothetical protein